MKKICLSLLISLFSLALFSQPWIENLPKNKTKEELTLTDYKNAFNQYWEPFKVDKGFYYDNGVKKKALGWKQFKRWEYNMESQVDKSTGLFPKKTAQNVYQEYLQDNPQLASDNISNWISLGSDTSNGGYNGIGRINCIAFHPTNNNIYWVGAASGGLWVTTNNGSSWACLTDTNGVLAISDIVIPSDYATSNTIYIATGDRDAWDNNSIGVLKSTNGGVTWNTTGLSYSIANSSMVNRLLLDPNNNQTIIAATSGGVYKTTDGGTTWNTQISIINFIDMEYKPGDFTTLYGSTQSGKIYVSTNGGAWTQAYTNASARRIELAVSANQPNWVYAIAAASNGGLFSILKSTSSGTSYSEIFAGSTQNLLGWYEGFPGENDDRGQGWYDLSLATSPSNANIVFVGGVNTWSSADGGINWNMANHWFGGFGAQAVHADKHALKYRNNGDLFECNDGGVYISTDNGIYWEDKTNGMVISQMYKLGVSQSVSNETITGLQDNGTKLLSGGSWRDVKGGDGMECLIDYTDVNIQYGTYVYGQITRTTDHWENNFTNIEPVNAGDGAWVTPYIIDPINNQTLYAGYANVWKTTNRGDSWTMISTMNTSNKIRSMAIAPSNTQVLYVADPSTIWKTENGGTLWTNITNTLPVGSNDITYIAVKNDDANTIWVTLSGYNSNRVYESINGGSSWTNISAGLPQLPAYSIVQNKQSINEVQLYIGTEVGIYFKRGSDNWILYNSGLPNVKIGELEIYYASNPQNSKLRAATYGRGLWESPVFYNPSSCNNLNFLSSKAQNVSGTYVELGSNGTVISTANFDDANSTAQNIGFDFKYNCQNYSQFILNTNGFIKLGNTPPSSAALFYDGSQTTGAGIFNSSNSADVNLISPFNNDLTAGTGTPEYRVYTSGSTPNRVCIIQFKNVRDKTTNPLQQYNNMQFQIKLYETTNIIEFIYGDWTPSANSSAYKTSACGLKGSSNANNQLLTISKGSTSSWDAVTFSNSNYTGNAFNFGNPTARPKPDIGRTYRFIPIYDNDLTVGEIYSLGDASLYYSNPQSISVNIINTGNNNLSNIPITLTVSGANNFTDTVYISALNSGANCNVTFDNFTTSSNGTTNIVVSTPNDDYNLDNIKTWTQNTNDYTCNYSSTATPSMGWGGTSANIFYAKYNVIGSANVNSVKAYIYNYAANIGNTVYGVVLNSAGSIVGQSNNYVIQAGDLGTWHNFSINTPPSFTDADFYAGFATNANSTAYYAMGIQDENPRRANTYYYSNIDGTGLTQQDSTTFTYRYMIGATLSPIQPVAGVAASNSTICSGTAASMSLTGYTGSIIWQQSVDGLTNWTNVSGGNGSNTANYTTELLSNTTYFRAQLSQPTYTSVYSNVITVTVNPLPNIAGTITGLTSVCQGQNSVIYKVPLITEATSYIWNLPNGALGTSTTDSIIVNYSNSAVSGIITVKGHNLCGDGLSSNINITVNPLPTNAGSISGIENICKGQNDVFFSVLTIANATTYIWNLPTGASGTSTSNIIYVDFSSSAVSGNLTVNGHNTCGDGNSSSHSVTLFDKPNTPAITFSNGVLHSNITSGNQWYNQNGIINGAINQDYTPTTNNNYHVIVTNGCNSDPSNVITITNVGINIYSKDNTIKYYPNPVSNELIIEFDGNKENISFEIINSIGQSIYKGVLLEKTAVQTNDFALGIYLIKLNDGQTFEFIKM